MIEVVHAAGQVETVAMSPDLSRPPSFAVVDPRRNWYYYVPVGAPTRRGDSRDYTGTVLQRTLSSIVTSAQRRINDGALSRAMADGGAPAGDYVRDDGVLDTQTLSAGASEISSFFGESFVQYGARASQENSSAWARYPAANRIVNAMVGSARSGALSGESGTNALIGLILLGYLEEAQGRTPAQVEAWLADGGISLGRSGSLMQNFPPVERTGRFQLAMPRATNFVRRNKVPLAIGGVTVVGLIATVIYFKSKD